MHKIGDKVWVIRSGRYGNKRSDYEQQEIVSETSRSWLIGPWETKYSKKGTGYYNDEQFEQMIWISENGYKIRDKISKIKDYDLLRKIADLIGYS